MSELPGTAAWRQHGAREGLEVVFPVRDGGGYRFEGHVTAVEEGFAWSVRYTLVVDEGWATCSARVVSRWADGLRELTIERDGRGRWLVDGRHGAALEGCEDVDLEASVLTNAFPVHRLALEVGEHSEAPAVYVRAPDLRVERLEQRYLRLPDADGKARFDYESTAFDYRAVLVYDEGGLVLDYPGIATRVV